MAESKTTSPKATEPEATPQHEVQGTDPELSRQAQFATYEDAPVPEQLSGNNPPPGRFVHQKLGKPSEGDVKAFGA